MYIQDDYWEAVSGLGKDSQDRIIGALVRLYYLDEQEPDGLDTIENAVFVALRERVLKGRARARSGRMGGSKTQANRQANAKQNAKQTRSKPSSKTQANGQANAKQNAKQTPSKTSSKLEANTQVCSSRVESEIEIERKTTTAAAVVEESGGGDMEIVYEDEGLAAFLAQALEGWNRISGKHYPALPGDCIRGLAEAYRNGVTPEQLDTALKKVGGWHERYRRTPRAAFADGNLYKWIEDDGEEGRYADLDEIFG